jgi:hypothetical protein
MNENLTITDGAYGILSETDIRKQIARLGAGFCPMMIEK